MPRFLLIASCILASLHASIVLRANYPADGTLSMSERYPGSPPPTTLSVSLPTQSQANLAHTLSGHSIIGIPTKGVIAPHVGASLTYTPTQYQDGNDTFAWQALNDTTGLVEQYTAQITITSVNNPPVISPISGNAFSFNENQSIVGTVVVFDPDSSPLTSSDLLRLDINGTDANKFDANWTSTSGNNHTYTIWYTPSSQPNFEALPSSYQIDLNTTDWDAGGSIVNQATPQSIAITLLDQPEAPLIVSTENPIERLPSPSEYPGLNEDEDTSTKLGFTPMEIAAYDPEITSNAITWSYTSNNSDMAGVVKLNGTTLAQGATSGFYDSGALVTVDYAPTADSFGTETLTFVAKDQSGLVSSGLNIVIKVDSVDTDPISLNESAPIFVSFAEEGTATVHDFNPTDPDSDADPTKRADNNSSTTAGAEIYYILSGADADKFQISATGLLTFLSAPDYETPLDVGGSIGDNIYELTVEVRDSAGASYTSDSQALTVTVTPINELPILSGGYTYDIAVDEDITWTWNSVLFDLNASDVDAGHQAILDWTVKTGGGGLYGSASVIGTDATPSAFSYIPDLDYGGDGNASNPDDVFVLEVSDGVGVTEVTFRVFMNEIADPPRITNISPSPLENISITRDRYTINLSENTPSTVRLEFNEVDGNGIGGFEIRNESLDKVKFTGSPYWTPGATYADLNFSNLHLPDFEDNQSSDGDGNYSLVVRVSDDEPTPKYQDIYLDFIIQNIDEAPAFAPEVDLNQTALENQTHAATLSAIDPEGVSSFHWAIIYGFDSPKFQLSSNSGSTVDLSFIVPPNFENPLDESSYGDKNNTYVVRVRVSDALSGGKSITQTFVITVTDDNDPPTISPTPLSINEPLRTNAMMDLSQYAFDEDNQSGAGGDLLVWTELSGDTTSFALDQNGTLRFNQDSDYETDSNFSIEVNVSDGRGGFFDANFTVEVNAVDEAPEFFENNVSNTKISFLQYELAEDTSVSVHLSAFARDPETGTSVGLTFGDNFVDYNGSNPEANGTLLLNTLTGLFTFTPKPNYSGLTYIDFLVSDGLQVGTLPVVFTVAEVPDPPVVREGNNTSLITGLVTKAIIESNTTFVLDLNASDPNDTPSSTTFIWSFGGPDATKFKIDPNPGSLATLSLLQIPDFESPHDAGLDNVFDLNVSVTDGGNSLVTIPIQLNILNGPEDPFFDYGDGNRSVTHKSAADFAERSSGVVFDVNATDLDGSPILFGLTGNGPDDANFTINQATGEVTFITSPDFEAPYGGLGDNTNTYVIEVNATDDSGNPNKIKHFVTVVVTNIIEAPTFVDGSTRSISWNESAANAQDVNRTFTEDGNQNLVLEISGGSDQSLFSLNVATGILSFVSPADYENPGSTDGDNAYDVQIRIVGTAVTQDLAITVTEGNDPPVVTTANLTQLTVDENEGFVVDLDVSDQDSGETYLDILYTRDSNSTRFVAHTAVDSSVSAFYPAVASGMVDNNLAAASFSASGDLDGDGDVDVICLEKSASNIHFMENNGFGSFSRKSVPAFAAITSGEPDHAVITDLDQDGDLDVVVVFSSTSEIGWFENNATGTGAFANKATLAHEYPNAGGADYVAVGDLDGDSYPDLVVAYRSVDAVAWYSNQGDADPVFTWKGTLADANDSLDAPRSLELVDMDNSGTLDVLIAANENVYLASNLGSDSLFSVSSITSFAGGGLVVKAQDFTADGLLDVVYASYVGAPNVLIQNATGFDAPIPLPPHAEPAKQIVSPTDLAILPATQTTRSIIVVSDTSTPYVSLFEAKASLDGQFEQPVVVDTGDRITSLELADLNRKSDPLFYSFVGGEDQGDFNATRFKDDGKLYFNKPYPNFEAPHDASEINRYDVIVKVFDDQGGETIRSVSVTVNEVNEPPVITSLDGNHTATYEHNEGNLTTLFDVIATNDESSTQTVTYSLSGGTDDSNFSIDSVTGRLTFVTAPDFELPSDSNYDNIYNVLVRATDNGQGNAYDEQNISVVVLDGFEPAKFDSNFSTSYTIAEDTSLTPFLLSATDQNVGGGIAGYGIQVNGNHGTASVTGNRFDYTPDGNFTGTDEVTVEVNNTSGLTTILPISITVSSINDLPVINTASILNHSENQPLIANLSAVDDSALPVSWSWTDGTVEDPELQLTTSGELKFRVSSGPDFEDPDQNKTYIREIRATDNDGNFTDGNFTINVINLNDNPPLSPHLFANASSTFTLVENNNTIIDLNASDKDNLLDPGFNIVSYAISGGPDGSRITVSSTGVLAMTPPADFEYPDSADFDNIYQAILTLSDGGYSRDYPIVVTITDADENAPVIISDGGGGTANISLSENTRVVTTVQATDVESNVFTFSIFGGSDWGLFDMNSTTGELSFVTPPDYEVPTDSDQNNLYEVYVRVSDGYSTTDQQISLSITDVDEIPRVSPSILYTNEDIPIIVTFTVSDPEGKITDSSLLTGPAFGELSFASYPLTTSSDVKFTYTPIANYHGADQVVLRVSDGTLQGDVTIPIEVNSTVDPPTANPDVFIYDDPTVASIFLDVLANDSSAPDSNTSDSLTFPPNAWTQPKYGDYGPAPQGSIFPVYLPADDFIGLDTFQYTVFDLNDSLESTGTVTIIVKKAKGLPNWRFSDKVGYYNLTATNWVYHTDLGWLYLEKAGGLETTTWVWSDEIGWFWTGEEYAPNVYLNDLSGWFAFTVEEAVGETPKKYLTWPIYDQTKRAWMTAADLKIVRVNTVLSQFDSLDKVISFVLDSALFTPAEKNAIKTELLFSGRSKTLESMGFTLGQ
jgi:hypothetical protein